MNLKFKCTRSLEIYSYDSYDSMINKYKCVVECIELDSDTYELPQLISNKSSQKIDNLYEEIKSTYEDMTLYKDKQWKEKEYEEFVSKYLNIDDYDGFVTRIDLIHWFEKIT